MALGINIACVWLPQPRSMKRKGMAISKSSPLKRGRSNEPIWDYTSECLRKHLEEITLNPGRRSECGTELCNWLTAQVSIKNTAKIDALDSVQAAFSQNITSEVSGTEIEYVVAILTLVCSHNSETAGYLLQVAAQWKYISPRIDQYAWKIIKLLYTCRWQTMIQEDFESHYMWLLFVESLELEKPQLPYRALEAVCRIMDSPIDIEKLDKLTIPREIMVSICTLKYATSEPYTKIALWNVIRPFIDGMVWSEKLPQRLMAAEFGHCHIPALINKVEKRPQWLAFCLYRYAIEIKHRETKLVAFSTVGRHGILVAADVIKRRSTMLFLNENEPYGETRAAWDICLLLAATLVTRVSKRQLKLYEGAGGINIQKDIYRSMEKIARTETNERNHQLFTALYSIISHEPFHFVTKNTVKLLWDQAQHSACSQAIAKLLLSILNEDELTDLHLDLFKIQSMHISRAIRAELIYAIFTSMKNINEGEMIKRSIYGLNALFSGKPVPEQLYDAVRSEEGQQFCTWALRIVSLMELPPLELNKKFSVFTWQLITCICEIIYTVPTNLPLVESGVCAILALVSKTHDQIPVLNAVMSTMLFLLDHMADKITDTRILVFVAQIVKRLVTKAAQPEFNRALAHALTLCRNNENSLVTARNSIQDALEYVNRI